MNGACGMLLYNDVGLEDVAPVRVVDIVVSPIAQAVTTVDRAVKSGADFVRIRGKTRGASHWPCCWKGWSGAFPGSHLRDGLLRRGQDSTP